MKFLVIPELDCLHAGILLPGQVISSVQVSVGLVSYVYITISVILDIP